MFRAPYPSRSTNVNKNRTSFANAAGQHFDMSNWSGADVYSAPVARYEEKEFLVNKYGKSVQKPQGKVGLRFAERVLDGIIPEEGEQMIVTLFESGRDPANVDSEQAVLDIERSPYPEDLDHGLTYPILIEEAPDGMNYGIHDFVVNHYGGDYAVTDFGSGDSLDSDISGVVDLDDMA